MSALRKKHRFFVVPAVCAAGAILFAAGCSSGSGTAPIQTVDTVLPTPSPLPPDVPVSATGRYQDLIFTATAPKRAYAKGENIPLTVTVQNTGGSDHRLAFALGLSGGVSMDFAVQGVLYSATGEMMGLIVQKPLEPTSEFEKSYLYPAGTTTTAEVINWDQTFTPGYLGDTVTPLPAGTYRLRLFIRAFSYDKTDLPGDTLVTDYLDVEIR